MNEKLPTVYLARHGETEWSSAGKHTGLTDVPLTEQGERSASAMQDRLNQLNFARVFTSPLQRVSRTCEIAGFGNRAQTDSDLVEWDYGDYEGLRTAEIHQHHPDWQLFFDGCPGGESPTDVAARADRFIQRVRAIGDDVLVFSSGHILRVFAARWLGLDAACGRFFMLSTASLSAVSYEHNFADPAISLWNDTRHMASESRSDLERQS